MISFVIPTRDRPDHLRRTLAELGKLPIDGLDGSRAIVVDNASSVRPELASRLANGMGVELIERATNEGAAARNAGALAGESPWLMMLDDDSHPLDAGFIDALGDAPDDVGAVSADIFLPRQDCRESGGLPEVFIGCGVAIRRELFLELGGYDASFGYYVEEYDLCAKLLLAGHRVQMDPRFRIAHHKVVQGRDMNTVLERLVRNNGWVAQRYAPDRCLEAELTEVRTRYRRIAEKENAMPGYTRGLAQLEATIADQPRTPMATGLFDRFTGLAHAREALGAAIAEQAFETACLVDEGKNAWVVRQTLDEIGVSLVDECEQPEALVIGTMSPGPMFDAFERRLAGDPRVIAPWLAARGATAPEARQPCR